MCFAAGTGTATVTRNGRPGDPTGLEAPSITDEVLREKMLTDIRRRRARQGRASTFLTGFAGAGDLSTSGPPGATGALNLQAIGQRAARQRPARPGKQSLLGGLY